MSVTRTDFIARDVACNTNVNMVTTAKFLTANYIGTKHYFFF